MTHVNQNNKKFLRIVDSNYEAVASINDIPTIKKYIDGKIVEYINIDELSFAHRSQYFSKFSNESNNNT